jgi:hypothetical protein
MGSVYVELVSVSGLMEAQIILGMLQAYGIDAVMSHEAAAAIYGLGIGPTAEVDILVPEESLEEAKQLLNDYHEGNFESE